MATGFIPQNQLNSLPLITAAQAATAGSLQIIGGAIYRFFTPAELGINASTVPSLGSGFFMIATPYLDLRGCSKYTMTIRVVDNTIVRADLPILSILMQTRQGPNDTPPLVYELGGSLRTQANAQNLIITRPAGDFPSCPAGQSQTGVFSWSNAVPSGSNGNGAVLDGANSRIILSFSSNPVAATTTFTAYLEAFS